MEKLRKHRQAYLREELPVTLNDAPAWSAGFIDQWMHDTAGAMAGILENVLVLAVGGYGRGELYPHSDIDLLLVLDDGSSIDPDVLAQHFFLPFWDAGYELGHGIRTRSETCALAAQDCEVLCSLLDARLLYGDVRAFDTFLGHFVRDVVLPERRSLLMWLQKRLESRHELRLDSPHLLSPNIKDGRGGQRDLQLVHWLQRIVGLDSVTPCLPLLSASEASALALCESLLRRTRVALHRMGGRKNDILHLEMQPELSATLGYGESSRVAAVEHFLADLHKVMTDVAGFSRLSMLKACAVTAPEEDRGPAEGLDFSVLASDPANILELFAYAARTRIPLSWATRRIIQDRVASRIFAPGWQRAIRPRFEQILCSADAYAALQMMLETGFLSAFLPDFSAIEHLVQFDAYHMLPAGPHLVETVRQLAEHGLESFLGEQLGGLHASCPLRWAALLHDIGKGSGDHSARGADMAETLMQRIGVEPECIAKTVFLIRQHLLLIHTATRRDLGEESVIFDLVQIVDSVDMLNMLALLTWADSRATGPKAWTPWIENLVREAYFKTRKALESVEDSSILDVHRLSRLRDQLRSMRPAAFTVAAFERFLGVMPPRYLVQNIPVRILEHIALVESFRSAGDLPFLIDWEHRPASRSLALTLVSTDRSGLFAVLCAAFARHGLSVLGADLSVWDDGTVVDVFSVTEPLDVLYIDETMERFQTTLRRLFSNEEELDRITVSIPSRQRKVISLDQHPVEVRIDNSGSDFYTKLLVKAPDVPGLLGTLSLCLYRLGIDVLFAKIATQNDKVIDIFHVRMHGDKIGDSEEENVLRTLRLMLAGLYA